ncbi:radical SAM protein [Alsobacter sp. SYSU M60028]|uniref:Radical SAM protein n=1 Tax=Alsobacter ponti TaxID=2962936 RepID=A0ABT1L7W5_9HYPH|nr:radical SAM protein [Alsobacter ponti]MCP8937564.1 radical SAM protein [Alsobacter ponti]
MNAPAFPGLASVLDDVGMPEALARDLLDAGRAFHARGLLAATPSFRRYDSDELGACRGSGAFPAFSITGGACALNCKHCRAGILKPMIPTGDPAAFERKAREMIASRGMRGFLLSGGSNPRNEVPFEPYLPVVARLKRDHPGLEVLVHTGLVTARRAAALKGAGVDVAMLDIIGSARTIREVYHLDRPVADFEASLVALAAEGLAVVPHIVVGLHFGRLLGEHEALDIIARTQTESAILVVLMPAYADPGFGRVDPLEAASFLAAARARLPDRRLLLGCARPHGPDRALIDVAAVLAGLDGVAYPADEAVRAARALGRPVDRQGACCGAASCARAA